MLNCKKMQTILSSDSTRCLLHENHNAGNKLWWNNNESSEISNTMTVLFEFSLLQCFITLMLDIKKILTSLSKVSTWCPKNRKYNAVH